MDDLTVRPARAIVPAHPEITPEAVRTLVERFYGTVRRDPRLGPIFEERLHGRWQAHLDRLTDFWAAVLLRAGSYKGQPVAVHSGIREIAPEDYAIWLAHFRTTAAEVFSSQAAPVVIAAAERIAESLWLARFGGPATELPDDLRSASGM